MPNGDPLEGVVEFLEPLSARSPFTTSRLAILPSGETRPVLQILAEARYGILTRDLFPFWLDGNFRNEVLENVGVASRTDIKKSSKRRKQVVHRGDQLRVKNVNETNPEAQAQAQEELKRALSPQWGDKVPRRIRRVIRRTPGTLYAIVQKLPGSAFQVLPVGPEQAESMIYRGVPIFPTSAQAHRVAGILNRRMEG